MSSAIFDPDFANYFPWGSDPSVAAFLFRRYARDFGSGLVGSLP